MEWRKFRASIAAAFRTALPLPGRIWLKAVSAVTAHLFARYRVAIGVPAHSRDVWYRVFTNSQHIRNGKVHHSAFNGKSAITLRLIKPEGAELSGRLLSYSGNASEIRAFGQNRAKKIRDKLIAEGKPVPSSLKFVGIGSVQIGQIREWAQMNPDVLYEPENDDDAHANLVFPNKAPAEITDDDTKRELSLKLVAIGEPSLEQLYLIAIRRTILG